MNATELQSLVRTTFGAQSSVRARRPNRLYQLELPAYLADGDGSAIFVEPQPDGRLRISDMGRTVMRLSYTRSNLGDVARSELERLADRHGFRFVDDVIVADVPPDEVTAGALGLMQIEAEAEVKIDTASRGIRGENFRNAVREILAEAFKGYCELAYHATEDADGLFSVDARIATPTTLLYVAVTPNEIDAERAVASKFFIGASKSEIALTKARHSRWVAVPRDANAFTGRTRQRLMQAYLVPVPKYEDEPAELVPKLRDLAA